MRVTVLGLSVCLSVYNYFRTTCKKAASERYQQLQCNKCSKYTMAILLKRRHSSKQLALSRTMWRDPAHQLVVLSMRVHTMGRPRPTFHHNRNSLRKLWHIWQPSYSIQWEYLFYPTKSVRSLHTIFAFLLSFALFR